MTRRNPARARQDGSTRLQSETPSTETQPDEVKTAKPSRPPQRTHDEEELEYRGGDLLGYAQVVARHPLATLVTSFSVGFGLGVLAVAAFTREDERWYERYHLPESAHDVSSRLRRIPGMIAQHLPDSLVGR